MDEEWKSIPEYANMYEASTYGNIRSLKRNTTKGRILKQNISSSGYLLVSLSNNGTVKSHNVHSLVAKTFLYSKYGYDINHIDGNKLNNKLCNLEYITRQENIQHSFDNKLQINDKGEFDSQSKRFIITYPNGTERIIMGLNNWCTINKIDRRGLYHVMDKDKAYRGYKCKRI